MFVNNFKQRVDRRGQNLLNDFELSLKKIS